MLTLLVCKEVRPSSLEVSGAHTCLPLLSPRTRLFENVVVGHTRSYLNWQLSSGTASFCLGRQHKYETLAVIVLRGFFELAASGACFYPDRALDPLQIFDQYYSCFVTEEERLLYSSYRELVPHAVGKFLCFWLEDAGEGRVKPTVELCNTVRTGMLPPLVYKSSTEAKEERWLGGERVLSVHSDRPEAQDMELARPYIEGPVVEEDFKVYEDPPKAAGELKKLLLLRFEFYWLRLMFRMKETTLKGSLFLSRLNRSGVCGVVVGERYTSVLENMSPLGGASLGIWGVCLYASTLPWYLSALYLLCQFLTSGSCSTGSRSSGVGVHGVVRFLL